MLLTGILRLKWLDRLGCSFDGRERDGRQQNGVRAMVGDVLGPFIDRHLWVHQYTQER